jgi:hypothetical protein
MACTYVTSCLFSVVNLCILWWPVDGAVSASPSFGRRGSKFIVRVNPSSIPLTVLSRLIQSSSHSRPAEAVLHLKSGLCSLTQHTNLLVVCWGGGWCNNQIKKKLEDWSKIGGARGEWHAKKCLQCQLWIIFLVDTISFGLAKNSNLQYVPVLKSPQKLNSAFYPRFFKTS